ncbi:hydantoinase/oxoprolinase family protein [Spectribacter hydrogenoxidans]|uniref:Hydantoinase/oxoprolinase family protein n=1 Tax=Spectribacter hydrogenoxidans TaxID=3075608 RepID=A0ABU3BZ77_9GAMM|nr:hydantoinase/oxoprolinase family protein [Salinisphaera sp. W335]MDT0634414.1 hydantoinase/oxoprolinase family protein [Salinisphaera sp. W335]
MTTRGAPGSRVHLLVGVDTGGTFTDFVAFDGEHLRVAKVASTPAAPERAVTEGLARLNIAEANLVHGSTVATNALLQGHHAVTAYVTNEGLTDVLTIGRQARGELYALEPAPRKIPVPPELCLAVDQRSDARGGEVKPLGDASLAALEQHLAELAPEAVAINLLYSFFDDRAERRLTEALASDYFVSRSSAVLAEYKEYERGITTWINASLGPRVGRYLGRLRSAVGEFSVMHSTAGTMSVERARERAVDMLLSGPAAGLVGARFVGRLADRERLLTFDMGGTSTDVALIDGDIPLTSNGEIGGFPVAVPMVDMHTLGAGGGSLARVDAGGLLAVGPSSAGADPGPACYGRGGTEATVTDANMVLGRLPASTRLGGDTALDMAAAQTAVDAVAQQLGTDRMAAAEGILAVVNEAMAGGLRVMSVQRGEDPRERTLLCFGGAGGLHVCALADALGMTRAMVPVHAGVLSALGMLVARRSREMSRSVLEAAAALSDSRIEAWLAELRAQGEAELRAEGVDATTITANASLDIRYQGQSAALSIAWRGMTHAHADFHAAHERQNGYRLDEPVEVVTVRLGLAGPELDMSLPQRAESSASVDAEEHVVVDGCDDRVPVYARDALPAGWWADGPAIVRDAVATIWLAPGWAGETDTYGNLLLTSLRNQSAVS